MDTFSKTELTSFSVLSACGISAFLPFASPISCSTDSDLEKSCLAISQRGDSGKSKNIRGAAKTNIIGTVRAICRDVHFGKILDKKGTTMRPRAQVTPNNIPTKEVHFPLTISEL